MWLTTPTARPGPASRRLSRSSAAVRSAAFTLVVNHLKSKGPSCDSIGDPDARDGQGICNGTRTKAMNKLLDWLSGSVIGASPDPDLVITGDLNSYAMEDPIQTAIEAGYADLSSTHPDFPRVSSYVFRGESGTLDYITASASAAFQKLGEKRELWSTITVGPTRLAPSVLTNTAAPTTTWVSFRIHKLRTLLERWLDASSTSSQ